MCGENASVVVVVVVVVVGQPHYYYYFLAGLRIDRGASKRLMATYGPFAATERLLMEAVKRGGNRQVLHEVIRECALAAWAAAFAES